MKPLLGVAVKEAVKLAILDSLPPPANLDDADSWRAKKAEWLRDIHSIPAGSWSGIDPMALAQNVAVRLLGPGGWEVNGVYAGNATPHQVMDACVGWPDHDPLAEILMDLRDAMEGGPEGD